MRGKFVHEFVALLLLATACGSRELEGTDGNTHWIECEDDSDCLNSTCREGYCRPVGEENEVDSGSNHDATDESMSNDVSPNLVSDAKPTYASSVQGAIGAACIPGDEYDETFSGFAVSSVYLAQSDQCDSNLCLVNHFQGRVTCPLGQTLDRNEECLTADGDAKVDVNVSPQLVERSPQKAVYCSCRCDGPDPDAKYCACGDGFECKEVTSLSVPGYEDQVGSYCIADNTDVVLETVGSSKCSAQDDPALCGDAADYSPRALGVEPEAYAQPERSSEIWLEHLNLNAGEPCLPKALPISADGGHATCRIFEAVPLGDQQSCERAGRTSVSEDDTNAVYAELLARHICTQDCDEFTICELEQLTLSTDPETAALCLNDEDAEGDGWCYVDPARGVGTSDLVAQCSAPNERRIRTLGAAADTGNSWMLIYCMGAP